MQTKSDILAQIDSLNSEHSSKEETLTKELFKVYDNDSVIQSFLSRVESVDKPDDYEFDSTGMLNSTFNIPFNLDDYPFFSEYIDGNYVGYFNEKENKMEVCHGSPITINWNHDRNSYFVYDSEERKVIIDKKEEWMDESYVAAMIAQWQNKLGCFGDVVETDYYGGYNGHFEMMKHLDEVENLDDKEGLQRIIDKYESENEEE